MYKNLDSMVKWSIATNETIYKNIIFTSSKFKVEVIEDQLSIRLLFQIVIIHLNHQWILTMIFFMC